MSLDNTELEESYEKALSIHYGEPDLAENILGALRDAEIDIDELERDDIASIDEFHIRGVEATREVAELAEIQPGSDVIDLGCGIGGPARTLAAEYGCNVVGVDLVEEYCRAAKLLTDRVEMDGDVTFHQGNALDLGFEDESYDLVWIEHVSMNIEDKKRLFSEAGRVLRPKGKLVLYEICAGPGGDPFYPVPWASDPSLSYLLTPDQIRRILSQTGFEEVAWRDVTDTSLEWFRDVVESMKSRPDDAPTPLGLNLLMGSESPVKASNVVRCLDEDRIEVIQGVFRKI